MKKTLFVLACSIACTFNAAADVIKSNVVINQGQVRDYGYATFGDEDTVANLTNDGTINANQIYIYNGFLVNNGIMNDVADEIDEDCYDFISLAETATNGYMINNGTINGRVFIHEGRTLTLNDGSYTAAAEIWSGTLEVNGTVNAEYMYVESGSEVVMTLGSSVNLMGGGLEFYDAKIVLLVDSLIEDSDSTTDFRYLQKNDLFVNFVNESYESDGFTYDTIITLRDAEGNETTRKYYELSVPEPATATLSLLALAGLAARRRRK